MDESRDLRTQILEAAQRLFIRLGYHGLSMRQIAEAVGVSKAALYYHFQDKEELFLAILDDNLDRVSAIIDATETAGDSSREQIRALVAGILALPAEQRAAIRLASQEMSQLSVPVRERFNQAYHEKFIFRIHRLLENGIQQGELRPVEPGVATWALLGMMYPYFYPAHAADVPPPGEVLEGLLSIYLDGLVLPGDPPEASAPA